MTLSIKSTLIGVSALLLLCHYPSSFAAENSPSGLWKTIDDVTKKPRSLVRITEQDGIYSGVVEKGLNPNEPQNRICDQCTDSRKNQPIIGMTIMQGIKQKGDASFGGGEILDPDNGKVYKCKLKLLDNGQKLEVRGFIGISLFGRSQTWLREE